ncbi:MAG: hypothetical protein C4K60_03980 [Ideonella sp. MAG2]|nr:MAG: hypothetical protein C4K60_03980 [Ideonella sp. MAG2]
MVAHPWQAVRLEPLLGSTAVGAANKNFILSPTAKGLVIDAKTGVISGVPDMETAGAQVSFTAEGFVGTLTYDFDVLMGELYPDYLGATGGFTEVGDASGPTSTAAQVVSAKVGQVGEILVTPHWDRQGVDASGAVVLTSGADLPAFTVVAFQVDAAPEGLTVTPIASPKGTQARITFTPAAAGQYPVRMTMRLTNSGVTRTLYPALSIQAQ